MGGMSISSIVQDDYSSFKNTVTFLLLEYMRGIAALNSPLAVLQPKEQLAVERVYPSIEVKSYVARFSGFLRACAPLTRGILGLSTC